jgi:hypothetical protein
MHCLFWQYGTPTCRTVPLPITVSLSLETLELWNTWGLVVSYKYIVTMMYSVVQISSYFLQVIPHVILLTLLCQVFLQVYTPLPILWDTSKLSLSIPKSENSRMWRGTTLSGWSQSSHQVQLLTPLQLLTLWYPRPWLPTLLSSRPPGLPYLVINRAGNMAHNN